MQVITTRQIDCSDPDEDGMYDYYYEYDIYEFIEENHSYAAVVYVHEPDTVCLKGVKGTGDK